MEKNKPLSQRCTDKGHLYKIFALTIIAIFAWWFFLLALTKNNQDATLVDPLNKIIVDVPVFENCCSWWPISHFMLFFAIGIIFPDCDLIAMVAGILWELFEVVAHRIASFQRQPVKYQAGKVEYSQSWWAGSMKDIAFNFLGFYSGKILIKVSS
jgi:hypothetical protein